MSLAARGGAWLRYRDGMNTPHDTSVPATGSVGAALTQGERAPAGLAPSLWRLAWRQTSRDLRGGELRLVLLAVVLAVAALTAVGFFVDRFQRGLTRDAAALIGGDAVVVADQPVPQAVRDAAARAGLRTAETATFPSMALAEEARGGEARLASVKAVSASYPLRGSLRITDARQGPERAVTHGPERGVVWVDAGLLDALNVNIGDRLQLGESTLRVAAVVTHEPDRGAGFSSFAPRVMLHAEDLDATGLIQPASRVTWRLGVAADGSDGAGRVRQFSAQVQALIDAGGSHGLRLDTLEGGRPEMRQTLTRAEQFLQLVALLAALLAAVAVGVAAQDFARRQLDACAMLRVLGLSQRQIAVLHGLELLWVAVLASVAGVLLGLAFHQVFVVVLGSLVQTSLPAPGPGPALFGLGAGVVLVLGFALPPVLQLASVPPLRVMRRELGRIRGGTLLALVAAAAALVTLLLAGSRDLKLGAITVGGFAVAVAVFAGVAWGAVWAVRRALASAWMVSQAPAWLRLATSQLSARKGMVVLQVSALGVGLLALFLLVLLRTDLIDGWRQSTPPDAPNRFVINVQPDQAAPLRALLGTEGIQRFDWYPMIRGRLVAINGRAVKPEDFVGDRAQRLVDREFNLSHSAALPAHNLVSAGRWQVDEAGAASVEEGLAQTLGLKLGDTLTFDMAGQTLESRITSLRRLDWASMRVNFFVLFPQATLPDLPATYISAYRSTGPALDKRIARDYPNVTQVDVGATLKQVQAVITQVSRAVEFLFLFALGCGLVVLASAVVASREQRLRDFAIMRALGAPTRLLLQIQRTELLAVGALAGLLAALAAAGVGWALASRVFEFTWQVPWWLPVGGMLGGALLALVSGSWSLRGVVHAPVVTTLRRLS